MVTALWGVVTPRYQWTTSIQWVSRSVSIPPPKSLKCLQRRKRSATNGWSGAAPSQRFQSSLPVSISGRARPPGPLGAMGPVASWYQ